MYLLTILFSIWGYSHPYSPSTCPPSPLLTSSTYRAFCSYSHHTRSPLPLHHPQISKTCAIMTHSTTTISHSQLLLLTEDLLYTQRSPPNYRDNNFLLSIIVKTSSALHIHPVSFSHSLIMYFHLCPTSQL